MACNTCGGVTTTNQVQYTVEQPAVTTSKPMTALEIIQSIKVTRTPNEPK